jgi:hypothetical protein
MDSSGWTQGNPLPTICALSNSDHKIIRFYQNATHSLLKRSDLDGTNIEYACAAKDAVPSFSSTTYSAIRGGSCAFAPALESEAFTLSVPTTPSTLDLTADTAGAVWSLRKER